MQDDDRSKAYLIVETLIFTHSFKAIINGLKKEIHDSMTMCLNQPTLATVVKLLNLTEK